MNKKISLGLAIALMAIAAALTFIISTSYSMNIYNDLVADVQQRAQMYTKLEQIDTYVRAYYDGSIDENALIEALAEGYISVLGKDESRYMDTDEYALYKEHLSGTHQGIGVYCSNVGGYPTITSVLPDSPASSAGLKVGEAVVAIGDSEVQKIGYDNAYALIRSDAGTLLTLTVRSGGVDRKVSITTTSMNMPSVSTELFGDYGYIKIYEFGDKSYQQFTAAYSMLTTAGVKGMVIDLRNNDGISHDAATNILSAYLPLESVVAVTEDLDGTQSILSRATGTNAITVPVTVLTNAKTAGPAELFAAALRDCIGAEIIGTTTKGEAAYTETYTLYDGAAIILPIATLRSASTDYAGTGLKPDFEVVIAEDTNEHLATLDQETDACLKKALEVLSQH